MILGNAHHIQNVPGRKTDVKDSEWLAELARHGLSAKSFVPPKPLRRLRELLRYRRKLMESRTAERNRLLKLLETANIKLASVMTDELGTDMTVFRSAQHAAAWAGVCPGNNESAGKRRQAGVRKGNVHLRTALVEAAVAASHTKGSYLRDKFYRLRARRGTKRAAMAIGHKILIAAYQMLATRAPYKDLGATYLDGLEKRRTTQHLVRRLQRLGYEVTLGPKVA